MKKVIFALLLSLTLCFGTFAQTDERKIEVIPTLSASGNGNGIALDSELIIAAKFKLSGKLSLYGQLGTMYNVYKMKFNEEWQLGFEPLVGIGTNHFRLSGFLNALNIKAFDTVKMPFVEGGVRFNITPWRKVWISVFTTWPISDPVFVMPLKDTYLETDEGVFLITNEIWARQEHSYGADIDLGVGKNLIFNLDGYAINNDNYQLGAGIQYQLFKKKPWVIAGNVFYTNFEDKDYFFAQNVFPQFLQDDRQGYSFKLGISNYGGLGLTNFNDQLVRIAQPQYYSPVKKQLIKKTTKIGEAFKFDPCSWGGKCLDFSGSLCITQGVAPYKIFADWGDGTEQYIVEKMGPYSINHHYLTAGEKKIIISGMDALGKTFSYVGKFLADDCGNIKTECENVTLKFDVSQNKVKKLGTVYFNWDVKGADQVTFDGKDVAPVVPKYPVIFNETGKFSYTLKAWNKGKVCLEETIMITVSDCDLPIIELFTAEPLRIIGKGSTLVTWITSGADTVTLNGKPVAASGSQSFDVIGPMDFTLKAENKCDFVEKTVPVDFVPCILCNDIYFHDGSSQTDNFTTGLPCGGPLHIPYTIYNESEWCEYDVEIKWQIFMDTDTSTPTYSGSYIVHVPANAHPLNLFFDFTPVGATIQCCYKKVELKIGACTN